MSGTDINGKKILFFSPAFFNYEKLIAEKMRDMGMEVDMYDVRSVTRPFERAMLKVLPDIYKKKSIGYYEDIINRNKMKNYDYILIVKCDMTPICILERFRTEYPKAKLCLYLWDSVKNIPGVIEKFKYFDTLHSFDLGDCEKYPILKFRPLFFADQFRKESKTSDDYKYDISFLGTIHSDRYAVIKQVQQIAQEQGLQCYWFLYLQSKFIFYFYKLTKREFIDVSKDIFSYDKMSVSDIARIVDNSRIILDIQHPNQTGLTIRTIEMVGMNKKLITTNESIKQYDFYNDNNVAVINRDYVKLPLKFLTKPYIPLTDEVYEKYSLKRWIIEVLN
ncbi:capsular biosynthesis protein CpsH [Erysipelotrichaceae bacterium RD49]|nr:capsular biosynthesis protein CpsH [Erysipelotrichaceae bacterium RD49]